MQGVDHVNSVICNYYLSKFLNQNTSKLIKTNSALKTIKSIPLSKICLGGENDISGYKYALMTGEYNRPSKLVASGPHYDFIKQYDAFAEDIFSPKRFEATEYYANALRCIDLFGEYFPGINAPEKIVDAARRFIALYQEKDVGLFSSIGHSSDNSLIEVCRIKDSSYYQLIQGNHRCAFALAKQQNMISAVIHEDKVEITPVQFLLNHLTWENGEKHLYQPIPAPELSDEWTLVRGCQDRAEMIFKFLKLIGFNQFSTGLKVLDIGAYFGWFLNEFESRGYQVLGLEKDNIPTMIAQVCYPRLKGKILAVEAERHLSSNSDVFDVTICLSIMHHMFYGRTNTDPLKFLRLIDECTKHVLFFEMGDENENWFSGVLRGWNPDSISKWVLANSSFTRVIILGKDQDRKGSFAGNYNRTLFAFLK